jgi:hypothetical protein
MRSNHRRITYQRKMNYWEIIADNLSKAGWSWGCVSAVKIGDQGRHFTRRGKAEQPETARSGSGRQSPEALQLRAEQA